MTVRIAGSGDTLEIQRVALGHRHGFAAARGTADIVGMCRGPAIIGFDDLLRHYGQPPDPDKLEIERGLLVLHEAAVERAAGALMAGVAGGDRKKPRASACRSPAACAPVGSVTVPFRPHRLAAGIGRSSSREARWRIGCRGRSGKVSNARHEDRYHPSDKRCIQRIMISLSVGSHRPLASTRRSHPRRHRGRHGARAAPASTARSICRT